MKEASYDRSVRAQLYVHLDNGETWVATDDDLERFGLELRYLSYHRFEAALRKVLGDADLLDVDITETALNPVRYLVEIATCHPDLLNHPDHKGWADVVNVETRLRGSAEAGGL